MIVAVTTFWYTWSMGSEENVGKGRYYPHSCRDFFFLFKAGKIREKKSGDFNAIFTNRRKTILRLTTQWFKVTKICPISHFSNTISIDVFITSDKSIIYITSEKQGFGKDPWFFLCWIHPIVSPFFRLWVTRKIRRPWVRIIRWSIIKTPSIARRRRRQNNREKTVILCENNH